MFISANDARGIAAKASDVEGTENLELAIALTLAIVKAAAGRQYSCTLEFTAPVEHSGNRTHLFGVRMIDEHEQFADYTQDANRICENLTRDRFEVQLVDRSLVVKW